MLRNISHKDDHLGIGKRGDGELNSDAYKGYCAPQALC